MESISKYFLSSKKRDLSDGSKTSEESKKKNFISTGILLNCLKNLEKEVLVDQNRRTQIKGGLSLADLSKSVKFITDKFDEYEK